MQGPCSIIWEVYRLFCHRFMHLLVTRQATSLAQILFWIWYKVTSFGRMISSFPQCEARSRDNFSIIEFSFTKELVLFKPFRFSGLVSIEKAGGVGCEYRQPQRQRRNRGQQASDSTSKQFIHDDLPSFNAMSVRRSSPRLTANQ